MSAFTRCIISSFVIATCCRFSLGFGECCIGVGWFNGILVEMYH